MKVLIAVILCIISTTFTGCVSYRSPLSPSATLPKDKGCLYGRFAFGHKFGVLRLALVVTDQQSSTKHRIRFNTRSGLSVIDVPPGEYKITHFTLAAMGAGPGEWRDIYYSPPMFNKSFHVDANHAYYLGDYTGSTYMSGASTVGTTMTTTYTAVMDDCTDNYEATTKELKDVYRHLSPIPTRSVSK